MKDYLQQFCAERNRPESDLAPHVREYLKWLNQHFDSVLESVNSPPVIADCLARSKQSLDVIAEKLPEHLEEQMKLYHSLLIDEAVKKTLFDILEGVQHSYDREPYVPEVGIETPAKGRKEGNKHAAIYFPKQHLNNQYCADKIEIPHAGIRAIAFRDAHILSIATPFQTTAVEGLSAGFSVGIEEQDHASDWEVFSVTVKETQILAHSDSKKDYQRIQIDSLYYTSDLVEMTHAFRRNDFIFNASGSRFPSKEDVAKKEQEKIAAALSQNPAAAEAISTGAEQVKSWNKKVAASIAARKQQGPER